MMTESWRALCNQC